MTTEPIFFLPKHRVFSAQSPRKMKKLFFQMKSFTTKMFLCTSKNRFIIAGEMVLTEDQNFLDHLPKIMTKKKSLPDFFSKFSHGHVKCSFDNPA